ncbi:MAG TPA: zinc-dependent metalloprotease [Longimicrobiales bacterium]|nr:zinc-dependent metalloprotease [Longimicrobiales bacterium]
MSHILSRRRERVPSRVRATMAIGSAACAAALLIAAAAPVTAQTQDYSAVVTAAAQTDRGLFDVHRVGERILFEIPDSVLGRDMALLSRYAQTQEGLADGGDRMAPNMVVRWERRDNRILLRAISHSTTADEGSTLEIAVANSNFPPILASLPIQTRGSGTSVVEVTDMYLGDSPTFSLPRQTRTRFGVRSHDRARTHLEYARSFPINVEVLVVRTYAADQAPSNARGGSLSFAVNHSMVLLPEEPMMPRLWDERVGYSALSVTNYSSDFQGVRPERYIRRYRLEPSDPEAWARGELVEPVKPWIWYIDPATPPEWVPYFIAGVEEWNEAFELAGFRNAIQARLAPTPEEDPEFSLLDARYSVIRYVATPTRSANSGGDVVDPRSGEVIRAHTNQLHGLDERLRWWLVSQLGAAYPQFQTNRLSQEDLGEALRYVVSHETAHSVGLPHNQRANFVFPIDSIRNPDFVARMGHSGSSVGRTRYNYTVQPGDNVPPERRIGEWDKFAVYWGYRPIPEARTPHDELPTLNRWITERADRPWFRFGSAQFGMDVEWDPYRMTEGISDDPVEAAVLGMNNLRTATSNLMNWVLQPGDDYYELETHYLQNLTQWNRFAEHAAAAVGGSWTHHKRFGEDGVVYTPIEPEYQRKAMAFIDQHVLQTPTWALDFDMLRRLEHAGAVERIRAYQELAVQRLLNHARLARMIEHEAFLGDRTYRPADMLDDAREMVWREVRQSRAIDTYRRNLQRAYLDQAHYLLHEATSSHWNPPSSGNLRVSSNNDPPLNADLHIGQSDIRPLVRDQLRQLDREIEAALRRGINDRMTRIHLEDARARIAKALD